MGFKNISVRVYMIVKCPCIFERIFVNRTKGGDRKTSEGTPRQHKGSTL